MSQQKKYKLNILQIFFWRNEKLIDYIAQKEVANGDDCSNAYEKKKDSNNWWNSVCLTIDMYFAWLVVE